MKREALGKEMKQARKLFKATAAAGIIAGILLLTGCGREPSEEKIILKQAPKLSITNGQESLALSGGTGEWNYRIEGDEWRGYVACGMHPVQVRYEEGVNILDSLDGSFVLSFDSEPDSVRVTVWEETAETDAEEFTEGMLLNTQKEEEGGWSFTLLQEGELVCEIFAEWEGEDYNGNSSYCVLLHN